jgi:hypothetical protein
VGWKKHYGLWTGDGAKNEMGSYQMGFFRVMFVWKNSIKAAQICALLMAMPG